MVYLIVPLPNKVFIPAEDAEKLSWDLLTQYSNDWIDHKTQHGDKLAGSEVLGDSFKNQIDNNNVIARTYLTYGWKYKARMLRNVVGSDFKDFLFYHELPRFVWVTEFGTKESLNSLDPANRTIFSHAVIDATASRFMEGWSIFHAPGLGLRWFHDSSYPFGPYQSAVTPIANDSPYAPKLRGAL